MRRNVHTKTAFWKQTTIWHDVRRVLPRRDISPMVCLSSFFVVLNAVLLSRDMASSRDICVRCKNIKWGCWKTIFRFVIWDHLSYGRRHSFASRQVFRHWASRAYVCHNMCEGTHVTPGNANATYTLRSAAGESAVHCGDGTITVVIPGPKERAAKVARDGILID